MEFYIFFIAMSIAILICYIIFSMVKGRKNGKLKFKDNYNGYSNTNKKVNNAYYNEIHGEKQELKKMFEDTEVLENQVETKIKQIDKSFNKEEFLNWVTNVFVTFQKAWTDRNMKIIKTLETNELFEQHKFQLQEYINNNTINVLDKICVKSVTLHEFKQNINKDILTIKLNSRMNDYIIDATTKEVIKGNKYIEVESIYYLTFIRETGNWVLSNLERI